MDLVSMLKRSLPGLVLLLISAQSPPSPLVSPQMKNTSKKENSIIGAALMKDEVKMASHKGAQHQDQKVLAPTNDIMIVDPKQMASDWKSAFEMLQNKQSSNLKFNLANGKSVNSIASIDTLEGGYLMVFTIKDLHGMKYKIIKTSEIVSLETE